MVFSIELWLASTTKCLGTGIPEVGDKLGEVWLSENLGKFKWVAKEILLSTDEEGKDELNWLDLAIDDEEEEVEDGDDEVETNIPIWLFSFAIEFLRVLSTEVEVFEIFKFKSE